MTKNCMKCLHREVAFDSNKNCEYNRCALDHDMRVNVRMYCDEWVECASDITRKKLF